MGSKEIFKKGIDKAFSKDIPLNAETMKDANRIKSSFEEETTEATGSGSSGGYSQPLFFTKKTETKEATGSGSVGAYETPAAWAKTTSKKDWRGKSKTQIPGGSFVSVKKKCKTFPYCNQGDIKSLKLYELDSVKEAIESVSKKTGLNETIIKAIIEFELEKEYKNSIS